MPRLQTNPVRSTMLNCSVDFGLNPIFLTEPSRKDLRKCGAFVLPPFQRGYVWTRPQEASFIRSIWDDLPIGSYVLNHVIATPPSPYDMWLLDGQQRWTAIYRYVQGEFPVYGSFYHELDAADIRCFDFKIFPQCRVSVADENRLQEIYERLAYGGTPHVANVCKPD